MSEKRHIVFASNAGGACCLQVAVYSIVKNVGNLDKYSVVILEGEGGIAACDKEKIQSIALGKVELRFVSIDSYLEKYKDILEGACKAWPKMAWARCFIGEVLPNINGNILYLDIDTYVRGDLTELFETPMSEWVIAMVPESDGWYKSAYFGEWFPSDMNYYCNSGVVLINLANWRKQRALESIFGWVSRWKENLRCPDQDALNALFYGKIYYLPLKWNYADGWLERSFRLSAKKHSWRGNSPKTVLEAVLNPQILHFWGKHKPWRFNHRPERKCYEEAMKDLGMIDKDIPGTNFSRRLSLPFYNLLHLTLKSIVRRRLKHITC